MCTSLCAFDFECMQMRSSAGVLHAYVMIRMTDLCGAKEKGSCGLLAFCFCLAHCCANLRRVPETEIDQMQGREAMV